MFAEADQEPRGYDFFSIAGVAMLRLVGQGTLILTISLMITAQGVLEDSLLGKWGDIYGVISMG